jgi:hypothetical protein
MIMVPMRAVAVCLVLFMLAPAAELKATSPTAPQVGHRAALFPLFVSHSCLYLQVYGFATSTEPTYLHYNWTVPLTVAWRQDTHLRKYAHSLGGHVHLRDGPLLQVLSSKASRAAWVSEQLKAGPALDQQCCRYHSISIPAPTAVCLSDVAPEHAYAPRSHIPTL